jgi:hypothetical protein
MGLNGRHTEPAARNKAGQFLKGHKSIGGRTRGSRNLLSEQFLGDLHNEWKRSGKRVLEKVARDQPETFLKVCSAVLPRLIDIASVNVHSELTIEARDFREAYTRWGAFIGAQGVPLIEAAVIEGEDSSEEENEGTNAGEACAS